MAETDDTHKQNAEAKPDRTKRRKLFAKQPSMIRMVYALLPVLVVSIYFFGWRILALTAVCTAAGIIAEGISTRLRGQSISSAVFVTAILLALSLPPNTPYWIGVVGMVVGIIFGKEVFGGFGRNFVNPAILGRAFVFVSFPTELTAAFEPVFRGFPGGFAQWTMRELPDYLANSGKSLADAISSATPMLARMRFGYETPLSNLLTGDIGGLFRVSGEAQPRILTAGSSGEISAAVILITAIYLLYTRTASWRLMLSPFLGAGLAVGVFRYVMGAEGVPTLAFTFLSGAFMYGAVYMVTEPVSGPKKPPAQWLYGGIIGFLIVLLRWRTSFSGAVAFSILIGNLIGPLLDMGAAGYAERKKAAARKASTS